MNKVIILCFLVFSQKSLSSTFFAPDGDTALLIQILGTELEATAGILRILETSSKTIEKMEEVHRKVEDIHTRGVQAEYYAKALIDLPKNQERVQSIVNLRNNLYEAKMLYDDRNTLTMGHNILKSSSDNVLQLSQSSINQNKLDRKLAMTYLKRAGDSDRTLEGSIYGARASAMGAVKLVNISDSLNLLNIQTLIKNDYDLFLSKRAALNEKNSIYGDYTYKMRWGMIPKDLTFKEYITGKRIKKVKRKRYYANRAI